jgi:hypothetical protein
MEPDFVEHPAEINDAFDLIERAAKSGNNGRIRMRHARAKHFQDGSASMGAQLSARRIAALRLCNASGGARVYDPQQAHRL